MREQSNVQCTTQCSVDSVTLTAKTVQKRHTMYINNSMLATQTIDGFGDDFTDQKCTKKPDIKLQFQ